jgi:hypothetical protein
MGFNSTNYLQSIVTERFRCFLNLILMAMPTKPQEVLSLLLFVALSCYVAFSGIRLGALLWQRFS